jgi:hypothetical protein
MKIGRGGGGIQSRANAANPAAPNSDLAGRVMDAAGRNEFEDQVQDPAKTARLGLSRIAVTGMRQRNRLDVFGSGRA